MVFSSYVFILAFLPVTVIVYYLLSHVNNSLIQRLFLIAASLFFYGYYNVRYLALILASISVNYVLAVGIQRSEGKKAKLFFVLGILFKNVGVLTLLVALVFGIISLVQKITGVALGGFTTVILLLLFIGSMLMISLGIIGFYLARIYDEIKGRPRYIISRICGREGEEA